MTGGSRRQRRDALGEMASEQPNGKQHHGGPEDTQVLPFHRRWAEPRNRKRDHEGDREQRRKTQREGEPVE